MLFVTRKAEELVCQKLKGGRIFSKMFVALAVILIMLRFKLNLKVEPI